MKTAQRDHDRVEIAIVGAGAVGLAAALALAEKGRQVAVLGPSGAVRDGRTVALLDGSWRLLGELGLLPALSEVASPLAVMRLVDDTGRRSSSALPRSGWRPLAGMSKTPSWSRRWPRRQGAIR